VNLRNREQVTVEPVEPPAVARPLAEVAADQERAVTGGLPDPAALVMAAEAAAVLGTPVQGEHLGDGPDGRTMIWRPSGKGKGTTPMLRVGIWHLHGARPVPPAARPVPGVSGGYVLAQGATLTVPPLTVIIGIHGTVSAGTAGADAMLAALLPAVEARLRQLGLGQVTRADSRTRSG
jgi:hypothetical protein